jgi:hypothetical protein
MESTLSFESGLVLSVSIWKKERSELHFRGTAKVSKGWLSLLQDLLLVNL